MRCVAVIPARGGSKGVTRKNLRKIGPDTLVSRAIGCCQRASRIDMVFVSTEDEDIAEESAAARAKVIRRPLSLASDTATSDSALLHACEHTTADIIALVQCTSPFMTARDIDNTINRLIDTGADLAIAVAPTDSMIVSECDGMAIGVGWDINDPITRRQSRKPLYEICGSVWALWRSRFIERGRIYSDSCVLYKSKRSFEIDTPTDLAIARAIDQSGALP